jgi:hypothetical protein
LLEKVLVLVLGWLLGLLSPIIVDGIKSHREAARGREAVRTELCELSELLVVAAFQARKAAGAIDKPFLQWVAERLRQRSPSQVPSLQVAVEAALTVSDEEFAIGAPLLALAAGKASMLQHYPVPLLDSRVSALWTFDAEYQRRLLDIHKNIALLDAIVDLFHQYFSLTFTQLSPSNHALVADNLRQCYENYAERARIVVDRIAALPDRGGA